VIALGGLRVLHEGWRPVFEDPFSTHPGLVYYLSAAWFWVLDPTKLNWQVFSAVLSLLTLACLYPFFRSLAGAPAALAALWFLSVMRWDLALTRGFPLHDAALFMALTLALWAAGMEKGKAPLFAAAGTAFALGLYTYHGYKPFLLLMAVLLLYEALAHRKRFLERKGPLLLFACASLLLTAPMLLHWAKAGNLGDYEASLFIGAQEEGFLSQASRNLTALIGCLHRKGDISSYVNFGSRPMLDGVTGLFLVLGVGMVLRRWKQRCYFYALAGTVVMGLNSLLSVEAQGTLGRRLFGALPFLALLAGLGWSSCLGSLQASGLPRKVKDWGKALLGVGLLAAGVLNFHGYFLRQALDPGYQLVSDPAATALAERIAESDGRSQFLLDARYDGHHTVRFMNHRRQGDLQGMDYPGGLVPGPFPGKQGACFVVSEGGNGLFRHLRTLHPEGRSQVVLGPDGTAMFYLLEVDNEALARDRARASRGIRRGLEGRYSHAASGEALVRWDPLVNFPHRTHLGLLPGERAEWKGTLRAAIPGAYEFLLLTEAGDLAQLWLDGKTIISAGQRAPVLVRLREGRYDLRLGIRSSGEKWSALSLAWKRPGEGRFEMVPNSAFGSVP